MRERCVKPAASKGPVRKRWRRFRRERRIKALGNLGVPHARGDIHALLSCWGLPFEATDKLVGQPAHPEPVAKELSRATPRRKAA